jgi:hypothetical protein
MSSNSLNSFLSDMREMREQLQLMERFIAIQAEKIEKQAEKIENNNRVIYSLVNGLFNHSNQSKTIAEYTEMVFGESSEEEKEQYADLCNDNKWGNYPTTRQGDDHEKRIEQRTVQAAS